MRGQTLIRHPGLAWGMKPLAEHMSVYAAYHRDPVNRAIHFVFVPAIVWSLMVALDQVVLVRLDGLPLTAAMAITGALLLWYLMVDLPLGIAGVAVFTMLLVSAIELNSAVARADALLIAGGVFVAGWLFQFLGHGIWEKRRPALADNLFQVLVAPLFLMAETAFALGLRQGLQKEVQERMTAHLPGAAPA